MKDLKNLIKSNIIFRKKKNIILQYGFQSYPTRLEDLNIEKLSKINRLIPGYDLSFADHSSYLEPISKIIPIFLQFKKIKYLEKHVCISRKKSKYDYQSALELNELKEMISNTENFEILKKYKKDNINAAKKSKIPGYGEYFVRLPVPLTFPKLSRGR